MSTNNFLDRREIKIMMVFFLYNFIYLFRLCGSSLLHRLFSVGEPVPTLAEVRGLFIVMVSLVAKHRLKTLGLQ